MSYLGRSAKLSRKTQEKVSFLATAGQTVKTGLSYVSTFVEVRVNGIILTDVTDYTATNGNSITFGIALSLDDEVTVISLKTFVLADHYSKTESDAAHYTKAASDTLVTNAVNALVDSSPAALDTLNELAAALGDDANFSTTVTNSIATKLPLAGGTMTGDTLHGDNVKAKFGTGGDLEIYHDGSNSYITEIGDGDLVLQSNGAKVGLASSSPSFEWMVEANTNGSVNLYHDSAQKLATTSTGVDISGTVTADGLTVGNAGFTDHYTQFRNDTEYGVAIGMDASANGGNGSLLLSGGQSKSIDFATDVTGGFGAGSLAMSIATNNDISFYEDTGSTAKFFWDASAESLGIGTTAPILTGFGSGTKGLEVAGDKAGIRLNGDAADSLYLISGSSKHWIYGKGAVPLTFSTNAAERMRIDSSGNVGIGTSSPAATLHVKGLYGTTYNEATVGTGHIWRHQTSGSNGEGWEFHDTTNSKRVDLYYGVAGSEYRAFYTGGSERMRIDSSGKVGIGTSSPSNFLSVRDGMHVDEAYQAGAVTGLAGNYCASFGRSAGRSIHLMGNAYVQDGYGIEFGAGGAASTLDDYEEGTWTPSFGASASATIHNTTYTKIGRLVHITGYFSGLTSFPTTSALSIGGLPFSGNANYQMAQVWYNSANDVNALVYLAGNSSTLTLRPRNGTPADLIELSVQMTYITNQ